MIVMFLSHWDGDREQANRLGRFIADIEPAKRDDVKIRFVARFDAHTVDLDTIRSLGSKFDVSWTHSRRPWVGWPDGPNGMAYDTLTEGAHAVRDFGWDPIDGFLLIEPDCVPTQRDWIDQLLVEWKLAREGGAWIMGSFRQSGPDCGHINGNCMVVPDLARRVRLDRAPRDLAWDCYIAPYCKTHWHITGLIRNDFQSTGATEERLRTPEIGTRAPVLVHGYKDDSAYGIARKWLLP